MNRQRVSEVNRKTTETNITLKLNLDGKGNYHIESKVGFFNHMLSLLARHGSFDLELRASGDLDVDAHHTVEDIGICLGLAVKAALGDKSTIRRFGHTLIPMDDALALVAVDISGRGYLAFKVNFLTQKVGNFDTELVEEFMRALAVNGEFTLHIQLLNGHNTHHICEAIFKALGRALKDAVSTGNIEGIPSTKGVI